MAAGATWITCSYLIGQKNSNDPWIGGIEQMSPKSGPDGPFKLHTGCGYVSVVTLVACVLLVINSFMVHAGLSAYQEVAPAELSEPRAQQAIQIVLPVILIFMEYWLYDRLVDRFAKRDG